MSDVVSAVRLSTVEYPQESPFSPGELYPEHDLGPAAREPNPVFDGVRGLFARAGLDGARFGSPEWNPLGDLMGLGETIVLKPNLVKEAHPRDPDGWKYVMTHGSVIRAVADYAFRAVGTNGRVILADAPQTDSCFEAAVQVLGLDHLQQFYRQHGLRLDLVDLRNEEWRNVDGVIVERRPLPGDPRGGVAYDLGALSEFTGHSGQGRYYGADYDSGVVNQHHSGGRHEYLISRTVMEADVVFSLPKLKTHKKAGITSSLKNLVGVNADKNWLPHHTEAGLLKRGDESPDRSLTHRTERFVAAQLRRLAVRNPRLGARLLTSARAKGTTLFGDGESVIRSGNWWGNDTVWRMCLDLNRIVLYGNPDGSLRTDAPSSRRRHFSLVDGVLAGHRSGPMNPDCLPAGVLLFGTNAAAVDAAGAILMGFHPDKVPVIANAFRAGPYPIVDGSWRQVELACEQEASWNGPLGSIPHESTLRAEPHFAWAGHIEGPW